MACQDGPAPSPKPRSYPKVVYPEKTYQKFDQSFCAFTFEYPAYAQIQQDTLFFEEKPIHPCWFDLYIPDFDSRLHCSYYPVGEGKTFEELAADAFELVDWHKKRASFVEEIPIDIPEKGMAGFVFNIEGPAASPYQFFVSDRKEHFLRGSLYFNTKALPDSLAPIHDFVKQDVRHIIESLEWM